MYDLNSVKPLEQAYTCEDKYCDDLVGFSAETWSKKITPWANELYRWGEDTCQ